MITYYFANRIIDYANGRTQLSDGQKYLALSTTAPNRGGTNVTEPVGNNYSRTLIGSYSQSGTQMFPAAADGTVKNNRQITFPKATGPWGTCTYALIFDAETGGHLLWYGALTTPVSPVANEVVIVEPENITITVS